MVLDICRLYGKVVGNLNHILGIRVMLAQSFYKLNYYNVCVNLTLMWKHEYGVDVDVSCYHQNPEWFMEN